MPSMLPVNERPQRPVPTLRDTVSAADRGAVRRIVTATGFFREDEIEVAVELVDERLLKGAVSGYDFVFAELAGRVVGYACYGPIACTVGSIDLYWIAVAPNVQRQRLGQKLIAEVEQRVSEVGGRTIYVETAGRPEYEPTRQFYQRCGYQIASVLPDFYDLGDDKITFSKACAVRSSA